MEHLSLYSNPDFIKRVYTGTDRPHSEWSVEDWEAALLQWSDGTTVAKIVEFMSPEERELSRVKQLHLSLDEKVSYFSIDGYFPFMMSQLCLLPSEKLTELVSRLNERERAPREPRDVTPEELAQMIDDVIADIESSYRNLSDSLKSDQSS